MSLVLYTSHAGVARIQLDRPDKRNAMNGELIAELDNALAQSAKDDHVRVVLITGSGKDFCAGLDLVALDRGNEAGAAEHVETARMFANILLAIRRHPRPVVAAVQGRALGGGAGIATASDLTLAAESASFGYPEVNIGFVPAIVASVLRRTVTEKQMFELLTSGKPIAAPAAQAIGLINRVFPDAEFEAGVEEYVQNLASKSATSLSLTKRLLYYTDSMPLEKAIEAGVQMNALSRTTADAQRGFAGFLKKKS